MKRFYWIMLVAGVAGASGFLLSRMSPHQAGVGLLAPQGERAKPSTAAHPAGLPPKGDTLMLERNQLLKLMPTHIGGYEPEGEPSGSYVQLMGGRYSVAHQQYRKGSRRLKMAIADYTTAHSLYNAATATYAATGEGEMEIRKWDVGMQGAQAWEILDRTEHKATVSIGLSDRLLITVEATPQDDTQEVRELMRELDMTQLQGSIW